MVEIGVFSTIKYLDLRIKRVRLTSKMGINRNLKTE